MEDQMRMAFLMYNGRPCNSLDFNTWLKCFKYLVYIALNEEEVSETYLNLAALLLNIEVHGTPAEEVVYQDLCDQLMFELEYINNGYDDDEGLTL